jgi:hypothetical protein
MNCSGVPNKTPQHAGFGGLPSRQGRGAPKTSPGPGAPGTRSRDQLREPKIVGNGSSGALPGSLNQRTGSTRPPSPVKSMFVR